MMIVELNGFDESGVIGENLRFVRVGIDVHNELRPFIYNLLHFGSLIMTKKMLKGQDSGVQKEYVRAILNDPAIVLNHYAFPPKLQLSLLRHFVCCEFSRIADKRRELIENISSPNLNDIVSDAIDYFRKYTTPWAYAERFIKSYGFRMVVEDLQRTSKVLRNTAIGAGDYKIVSLVDGGYPLVFWGKSFLQLEDNKDNSRFSTVNTSIYGVSNGDEYFPVISLAGNVASITNRFYEMIFPQSIKEVPYQVGFPLEEYCKQYEENCSKPKFFPRILFIGGIEANLQYSIPFIHYKNSNHRISEPFRVRYKAEGSFRSFYRQFRGDSGKDIIVFGHIETPEEEEMFEECQTYGLKMVDASSFLDLFEGLLNDVGEQSRGTNLDRLSLQKIETKLNKIKEIVKESIK